MPDETNVPCPDPDPNEPVTRRILAEELAAFRREIDNDIGRRIQAYEEQRVIDRRREAAVLEENLRREFRVIVDMLQPFQSLPDRLSAHDSRAATHDSRADDHESRIADHESRIVRLEARPPKRRARKPSTRKPSTRQRKRK